MVAQSGQIMTLANSIIGVGILAMPYCFQKCGIFLGIVLLLASNILTRISCFYLIKSSVITRRWNFEYLAFHAFGFSGKLMVELCVIGYLMGTCIAYFVVVGDLGPQIISKLLSLNNSEALRTWLMIFVTLFCVIPLGLLKNVDSLSAVCTASIGFYFCLVLKVMIESKSHIVEGDWIDKVDYWKPSGVLQCLPIFSMALSCQMQIFEVFETVPNASIDKMNDIIKKATNICTCVYIFVGCFGYIAFCTQDFSGNILLNFSQSFTSEAIKVGFVLSIAFSFPLVIFPCRASLYSLVYKRNYHSDASNYIPESKFRLLTLSIVFVGLVIGLLIPSIELVIGLVGSTIGVAICIMFPSSCFLKVSKKESNERMIAQFILFFGFTLMVLGTFANLNAIDEKKSGALHEIDKPIIVPGNIPEHKDFDLDNLPNLNNVIDSKVSDEKKLVTEKSLIESVLKENIISDSIQKLPHMDIIEIIEPKVLEQPAELEEKIKEAIKIKKINKEKEEKQKEIDVKEKEENKIEIKKSLEIDKELEKNVIDIQKEVDKQDNEINNSKTVNKDNDKKEIERNVNLQNDLSPVIKLLTGEKQFDVNTNNVSYVVEKEKKSNDNIPVHNDNVKEIILTNKSGEELMEKAKLIPPIPLVINNTNIKKIEELKQIEPSKLNEPVLQLNDDVESIRREILEVRTNNEIVTTTHKNLNQHLEVREKREINESDNCDKNKNDNQIPIIDEHLLNDILVDNVIESGIKMIGRDLKSLNEIDKI